jgi:fatty acid synthase, animal type
MFANRVSYSLGLKGPSLLLDSSSSSSMYALDMAWKSIRDGHCDAALVGASNLLLHYDTTRQFSMLGLLAPDGFCRPFDINATGYTRSEAVSILFLQKAKDAKRVYGSVVYSKTNYDGYKADGIIHPCSYMEAQLLTEFYQDIGIDPASVAYVEANGTGLAIGDSEECSVLDKVFCKNRQTPLPVGSIKSNIGHAEAAAGSCSITKALLALDKVEIAPNINFTECRKDIPSLNEGRIKIVTENTPLEGEFIAVNGFGFSGSNAHCLLRASAKEKINFGLPQDNLPRLVTWAGRTEESVHKILEDITQRPIDVEHVALLHNIQQETTPGHVFRGFALYEQKEGENASSLSTEVQHFTGLKRPLVFIFSGMGSQWCEMGTSLMNIPIFRESIQKSHNILEKHGIDLINILTSTDQTMYDNILHSFIGIAAIQIALVDILKVLGIKPDYIVGHSVGELGCAYADDCLTAEQMILAAYSRGIVSLETKVEFGSMAAVGIGYRKIRAMIPSDIEVACHNSPDSCTISGPAESISDFVTQLKRKGIFAKEVPCSNIPYHSNYIAEFGPKLLARLKKIIPNPMKRSAKWLSSSVPKIRWDLPESRPNIIQIIF